jgi:hypothetical protein
VWEKIEHIHRNPVERGLVETPEKWQSSSAADLLILKATAPKRGDRFSSAAQLLAALAELKHARRIVVTRRPW